MPQIMLAKDTNHKSYDTTTASEANGKTANYCEH